jgi:2-polyprenyl-3-methyl-5-hydroxy-6-metoxy-1,4-benzoquinol methylase
VSDTAAGPYATLVADHGFSAAHRLVLDAVAPGARVLDVGCATGYLARELRTRRGAASVDGVEFDPVAAEQARAHCREVVSGDLEAALTREAVAAMVQRGGGIDTVVCADVLEHLRDPWSTLAWLRTLLPESGGTGQAIVSIPNIAHWTARRALLRGHFDYAEHGLFDRTHLRFFTRDSVRELARRAGFAVRAEHPAGAPLPLESRLPLLGRVRDPCVRRCPELFALQFVLVLVPVQRP